MPVTVMFGIFTRGSDRQMEKGVKRAKKEQ